MPRIEKADKTGFCFGVRRAINLLEEVARERGGAETLGAVVHNQQVLQRLAEIGVWVVNKVEDITSDTVVTSSHGVTPETEERIRERRIEVINTTCPFVRRAQVAARRLAEAGFFVIVYGDAQHPEVTGILGWAKGQGLATLDEKPIAALDPLPRRIGILSQTTQVPAQFIEFAKKIIDIALVKDAEVRIIDTICHDIRERQAAAIKLARRADLMLVVGGRSSANTNRLAELCAGITETHLIETAAEIKPEWLKGKKLVGVTAGASTAEQDVDEVLKKLREGLK
ncbi:MAG TPA: 4-hydroxy-3-methylbut-2-enyl diphosphate reductase [Dehalococcoidales bacterium]|nr:4-hydroxy-3-methylbut-2-enyl diphosphate reductase [Dehalococcoidales bacterium]